MVWSGEVVSSGSGERMSGWMVMGSQRGRAEKVMGSQKEGSGEMTRCQAEEKAEMMPRQK